MAQIELLMVLQDHQPGRIGEIADQLRLAPNTASGLVQQLVDAGFIYRGPAAAALDALTPADRHVLEAALPALGRLNDHLGQAQHH
jgi:DNA-binding IclR family transcriptional regulator